MLLACWTNRPWARCLQPSSLFRWTPWASPSSLSTTHNLCSRDSTRTWTGSLSIVILPMLLCLLTNTMHDYWGQSDFSALQEVPNRMRIATGTTSHHFAWVKGIETWICLGKSQSHFSQRRLIRRTCRLGIWYRSRNEPLNRFGRGFHARQTLF